MSETFAAALRERFGDRVTRDAPLASLTTFRVGGTADWLLQTRSPDEVVAALRLAHAAGVPVTVLGGGSNVVISDRGIRGLVLRVHGGDVVQEGTDRVRADAGVTINGLVRWTIPRGFAGLERWAGTPGTVGGAIHGNAHFQGELIGDVVDEVRLADHSGTVVDVPADEMDFGYDRSRLQSTGEIVLSASFLVTAAPVALREVARASLAFRKRTQPLHLPSAGCLFQNPDPAHDVLPPDVPWSAGALVDRAGQKGARVGGAAVSVHANFVVNDGSATADDIRALASRCRQAVLERFGVRLRDEVVYLGEP